MAQKRTQMCTYLKHMGIYKHKQLMGKSYDEIQKLFDKEMKRQKEDALKEKSKERATTRIFKETKNEGGKETDELEEDDEAELKKHLVIKQDDDIAIDAIPLATKPPVIVDYKLLKEGIMRRFADSLEVSQKKHGDIRPKDDHERVM
ncbi:hypothetical protein Tco_0347649 [Tanacetum coccineum]